MSLDLKQSSPQISDSALRLPGDMPPLPDDVLERFPSLGTWQDSQNRFWRSSQNAIQDFARAVLDVTEIAGVLVVDPGAASLYIKRGRGPGKFNDADTPFFVDRDGRFSLGTSVVWNPATAELVVTGTIIADAGVIGGWIISPTTLSKNNAVLDSAGQLALGTGNDVVILSATDATYRIWVGNATAATATFSVTKLGAIFSTAGTIGGFSLGTDYIRDVANSMGLASTVTGGDDVRFWSGATFANRATAPFRVTEAGVLTATSGTFSGTVDIGSGATRTVIDTSALTLGFGNSARAALFNTGAGPTLNFYYANDIGVGIGAIAAGGIIAVNTTVGVTTILLTGSTGAIIATSFAGSGASLTALNATQLTSGTVPDARFPATLPAIGGGSLTGITATQVGLGNVPNVDATNASNISSGTLPAARLSFSTTGTADVPITGFTTIGGAKCATVA